MIKRWPCPCHADTPNKISDLRGDARPGEDQTITSTRPPVDALLPQDRVSR